MPAIQHSTSDKDKVVFLHVTKTGGVTFRGVLSSIYGPTFHFCTDPTIAAIKSDLERFNCLELHTAPCRGGWVHVHKQIVKDRRWDLLRNAHVFTMLREPVSHAISMYYHMVRERRSVEPLFKANETPFPESLEEFAEESWRFNGQVAFLNGGRELGRGAVPEEVSLAREMLAKVPVHVGLVERYAESLHVFETVTGRRIPGGRVEIKNGNPIRPRIESIPARVKEQIRRFSWADCELYEFAQLLLEREIGACGDAPDYAFDGCTR
jgi:hypothetical protein